MIIYVLQPNVTPNKTSDKRVFSHEHNFKWDCQDSSVSF